MSEMEINQTDILITRYVMNDLEGSELIEFERWMNQSADNIQLVNEYRKIWESSNPDQNIVYPDLNEEWNKLNSAIENQSHLSLARSKSFISWKLISSAAAVFVIACFGIYQWKFAEQVIKKSTGNSQEIMVSLPDGSEIKLNHNSEISYKESDLINSSRKIFIRGEAFIQVTHDAKHPFTVETGNSIIQVIGTKFNVKTRNEKTVLTVTEGKVSFRNNDSDHVEFVTAGLTSSVIDNSVPSIPLQTESGIDWLNNSIFFDQSFLSEVVDELNGKFDVHISISDNKLNSLSVSGKFTNSSAEQIISSICISLNLRYKVDGKTIVITE